MNGTTGAFLSTYPDVFSRFIYDQTTGLHWDEENDTQRAASAINTYKLLWDGAATRLMAPLTLQSGRAVLRVNAPAAIAGDFAVGPAAFGPALSDPGVTGAVVLADDGEAPTSDACTALINSAQITGKIAIVDRGDCLFTVKAKACQDAGAIGVIVADNVAGSPPSRMSGTDATITIPSVRVTLADGTALKARIAAGLDVTLLTDPALLAGADAQGRMMLYTPDPFQPSSSVSHWDVSATPNLLMEPNVSSDLTSSVDLTRCAFEDMGWLQDIPGVPVGTHPAIATLRPNAPNPFTNSTRIRFEVPRGVKTDLGVYDVAGRLVRSLVHERFTADSQVVWDGIGANGQRVQGGVYFTRLKVGGEVRSRRIVFVR